MTSANVTEYKIFLNGVQVGRHYQNHLCKDRSRDLLRFNPPQDYAIQAFWLDEEEEYFESNPVNLLEWLNKHRWFALAGKISK